MITEEIKKFKDQQQKELEDEEVNKAPEKVVLTAEEYQRVTGWVIYAVAAGPHGMDKGNIWQQEYYVRPTNEAGYTFHQAYANFNKGFYEPFSEHIHNSPDVRASRVVQKSKDDVDLAVEGAQMVDPAQNDYQGVTTPTPPEGQTHTLLFQTQEVTMPTSPEA
ncbi:hypothetical protein CPB84DRAFT_1750916 [Gymnopilus junonius]|uniref:Uncharacterized protein n=1 Tax=Gymnopilus junonius TaxID=109634 RepID=A0A9P5NCR3_GYMJU|nr:hypothetical protein CPB84DRAFT_1750916 [Gymnopilus junonius]